jgi:hypothetical protein
MKKYFCFVLLLSLVVTVNAQRKPFVAPKLPPKKTTVTPPLAPIVKKKEAKKSSFAAPSRDYVMLQAGLDGWSNLPDSIKTGGISRAFNAYLCYDFPITKSNFSFAVGLGVASSNIYFKNQSIILDDTSTTILFKPEVVDYKKFKFNTTYLEAPFELRYFSNSANRNKGIKAAIGLKVGTLISAHTKSKRGINNKPVVEKVSTKRYVESYRYSATLRVGYGNFSVYGQYGLSNVFRVNNGPVNVRPYQIGICISGL